MHLRKLTTAALIVAVPAFCVDAATLTCQDRSVRAFALLPPNPWLPPYIDSDSARAADFGLFDRNANAFVYVFMIPADAGGTASQRSEIAGSAIHALCAASAFIRTLPSTLGEANGVSQLEVCFRLHAPSTITVVAVSTATTGREEARASASFVLSGPGGLLLELQRTCGPAGCDPDSTFAATMPIPAGDYTLLASARAEIVGPVSGYPNGLEESGITLDISVSLDEPLVGVMPVTWTDAKRIYRRRPRPKARTPRAKSFRS